MGAPYQLVKALIRGATEDASYAPIDSVDTVYARIRAIQQGHFDAAVAGNDGLVQISSQIGQTQFGFAMPAKMDRAQIIEIAEEALGLIEGLTTVAAIRARVLPRRKTTRTNFSSWIAS